MRPTALSTIVFCFFLPLLLPAQSGTGYQWALTAGGPAFGEFALDCDVTRNGDIYMAGEYFDGAIFGNDTLASIGNNDLFLARVTPYGEYVWVNSYGSTELDRIYALDATEEGSLFIAGNGKVVFPNLVGGGPDHLRDALVARFDQQGNLIWGHNLDGDIFSEGTDIVGNEQGECYLAARMETTSWFGTDTVAGNGGQDGLVIKWSASGNFVWGTSIGGAGEDDIYAMGMDGQENIVLGGFYEGNISVGSTHLTGVAGKEAMLVKMDSAGNFLWAKGFNGPGDEVIKAVKAAPDGSIYFAGEFEDTMVAGGTTLTASNNLDIFYGKADPAGNVVWIKRGGGFSLDFVEDLAIDDRENLYFCGFYFGNFGLDATSVTSGGFDDMYIAKTDSLGTLQFLDSPHYTSSRNAYGIAVDQQENAIVSGSFFEILDLIPGNTITAQDSSIDLFLTKYATLPPAIIPREVTGLDGCTDSLLTLNFDLQGYFPPINIFSLDLSDAAGSFAAPTPIGAALSGIAGTITGAIPLGTPSGSGYRVRLRSSSPVLSSADNGVDLTFEMDLSPGLVLVGDTVVCNSQPTLLQVSSAYDSVRWSTGATTSFTGILTPGDYWVRAVDTNGCSQYLDFTVTQCVGLSESPGGPWQLYPNPSEGRFQISRSDSPLEPVQVHIYDLAGRLHHTTQFEGPRYTLELSHLAAGVYHLQLGADGDVWHQKIYLRR